MHFDWQVVVTVGIVGIAVWHVGRILAAQIAGFRKSAKPGASGCSGCESGAKKAASPQLITLSAAPLRRVVVPKMDETGRND